jgi:hypothetical protein
MTLHTSAILTLTAQGAVFIYARGDSAGICRSCQIIDFPRRAVRRVKIRILRDPENFPPPIPFTIEDLGESLILLG